MNEPVPQRSTIFRDDAVARHVRRAGGAPVGNLDPLHWLSLLWLVVLVACLLAAVVVR
jgi:hypothetical protein